MTDASTATATVAVPAEASPSLPRVDPAVTEPPQEAVNRSRRDPSNPWGAVVTLPSASSSREEGDGASGAPPPSSQSPSPAPAPSSAPSLSRDNGSNIPMDLAPTVQAADTNANAKQSFAEIVAQQESERRALDRLAAEEADRRLAERLSAEAEPAEAETDEERMMRMALAESLAESRRAEAAAAAPSSFASAAAAAPSSSATATGGGARKRVDFNPIVGGDASGEHCLDLDEQMRLAIELSLRESHGAAGGGANDGEDDGEDGGGKKPAAAFLAADSGEDAKVAGKGYSFEGGTKSDATMPAATAAKGGENCDLKMPASASASASVPTCDLKQPPVAAASASASAASLPPDPHISEDEALQIERALREADDAETAASMAMAMQLQVEEDRRHRRDVAALERDRSTSNAGNVRTTTKADFLFQRGDNDDEKERGDEGSAGRKLWGADDYESHQEHFALQKSAAASGSCRSADDDDDDHDESSVNDVGPHEGFRMNASTPSKSWSRLDRNTIVSADGEIRTKHDVRLKNVSNAERLLAMAADDDGLGVGGISGVSDRAYNDLRQTVKKRGTVKGVAAHGTGRAEDYGGSRTREGGMDQNVRLVVSRAINRGLIQACNGAVKEGKEAMLYHAEAGRGMPDEVTGELSGGSGGYDVAVKVFKRIQEFRSRGAYVDGDPRYRGRSFADVDKREQVELWAEKEYRNLIRANRGGVPVPTPLHVKENVLFMRFLGDDGWPAPQMREVGIKKGSPRWEALYCSILLAVRKLYHRARLVHGDLSEYNVLVCPARLVDNRAHDVDPEDLQVALIDLGQAVDVGHPRAGELLARDLEMIRSFFARQGIRPLMVEEAQEFVHRDPSLLEEEEKDGTQAETEDGDALKEDKPKFKATLKWNDALDIDALQEKLARIQAEAAKAAGLV